MFAFTKGLTFTKGFTKGCSAFTNGFTKGCSAFIKGGVRYSHSHSTIKPLLVYTDGSYIESVKKGGMGIYFPNNEFTSLSIPYVNPVPPTNQRCELLAIKYALIIHSQYFSSKPLHLYTDSKYAIECLTIYNDLWSKNGWLKTNGQSVKNQDLLKSMISHLSEVTNVQFNYVKAHTNSWDIHSLNNNVADAYARRGVMAKSPVSMLRELGVPL
jgi:ribonuclease HI